MDVQLEGDLAEGVKALQTTLSAAAERLATDLRDRAPRTHDGRARMQAGEREFAAPLLSSKACESTARHSQYS